MSWNKQFSTFLRNYRKLLGQFGDLTESTTAMVLYAMAHDVCATEAEADTAALRNVFLFAAEHRDGTLDATDAHLDDPMSRLRLWKIADAPGQERWMHALNLRQLKNWHAKGLRDYSVQIDQHTAAIREQFSQNEIRDLDLLQTAKGTPVFGMLAQAAVSAAAGAVAVGFWR